MPELLQGCCKHAARHISQHIIFLHTEAVCPVRTLHKNYSHIIRTVSRKNSLLLHQILDFLPLISQQQVLYNKVILFFLIQCFNMCGNPLIKMLQESDLVLIRTRFHFLRNL